MSVWTGKPWPLGANWTGDGVNVAVYSPHATAVEVAATATPTAVAALLAPPAA